MFCWMRELNGYGNNASYTILAIYLTLLLENRAEIRRMDGLVGLELGLVDCRVYRGVKRVWYTFQRLFCPLSFVRWWRSQMRSGQL